MVENDTKANKNENITKYKILSYKKQTNVVICFRRRHNITISFSARRIKRALVSLLFLTGIRKHTKTPQQPTIIEASSLFFFSFFLLSHQSDNVLKGTYTRYSYAIGTIIQHGYCRWADVLRKLKLKFRV